MRVALITVGNEILSGDTVNTNAAWLGSRLTETGATVERMTTLPDRVSDIARIVNEYRAEYDAVVVGRSEPARDDDRVVLGAVLVDDASDIGNAVRQRHHSLDGDAALVQALTQPDGVGVHRITDE
jgi:hypothetical protein